MKIKSLLNKVIKSKVGLYGFFLLLSIILGIVSPYPFYVMMLLSGIFAVYFLYSKASNLRWRAFSLRLLGGVSELCGFLLLGIGLVGVFFTNDAISIGLSIFFTILGIGLLIIGAMLILRFKMKSGIIIYHGRA